METFVYASEEFQKVLATDAHHIGEVRFLQAIARAGMCALDVGANRGVTTVALAREVGRSGCVCAFEPVPEYCEQLRGNLSANGATNVSAHMLALSDRKGRIAFHKHGEGSGVTPAEDATNIEVDAITLPEFLATHGIGEVNLINMDCEGSELRALDAAADVLRRDAPRLLCEIHHGCLGELGQSAADVVNLLEWLDYDVRPVRVENPRERVDLNDCTHIYASSRSANDRPEAAVRRAVRISREATDGNSMSSQRASVTQGEV